MLTRNNIISMKYFFIRLTIKNEISPVVLFFLLIKRTYCINCNETVVFSLLGLDLLDFERKVHFFFSNYFDYYYILLQRDKENEKLKQ